MKLPIISGDDVIKVLKKLNLKSSGTRKPRFFAQKDTGGILLTVVPRKPEIKRGTLLGILRQAGISRERVPKTSLEFESCPAPLEGA